MITGEEKLTIAIFFIYAMLVQNPALLLLLGNNTSICLLIAGVNPNVWDTQTKWVPFCYIVHYIYVSSYWNTFFLPNSTLKKKKIREMQKNAVSTALKTLLYFKKNQNKHKKTPKNLTDR